jgi:hypothetical protein
MVRGFSGIVQSGKSTRIDNKDATISWRGLQMKGIGPFKQCEVECFANCPKRYEFKYVEKLKKPIPLLRAECDIHKHVMVEAIAHGMTAKQHEEALCSQLEYQYPSLKVERSRTLKDAKKSARVVARVWHHVMKDMLDLPGRPQTYPTIEVPIGRYRVSLTPDIVVGRNVYIVVTLPLADHYAEWDSPEAMLAKLAQESLDSDAFNNGKLTIIYVGLDRNAEIVIESTHRGFGSTKSGLKLEDMLDLMRIEVYPRMSADPYMCDEKTCEYWDVCWRRR